MNRAAKVCTACKRRKRACDKTLPRCDYCVKRGLVCCYDYGPANTFVLSDGTVPLVIPSAGSSTTLFDTIKFHVLWQRRSPRQIIDDFLRFRHQSPVLALVDVQLLEQAASDASDSIYQEPSALLLAVCILTEHPNVADSLHTTLRLLISQSRRLQPCTSVILQAELVLACYEYSRGWLGTFSMSVETCIRAAMYLKIHERPEPEGNRSSWLIWQAILLLKCLVQSELSENATEKAEDVDQTLNTDGPIAARLTATADIVVGLDAMLVFGLHLRAASLLCQVADLVGSSGKVSIHPSEVKNMDDELQAFLVDIITCQHKDPARHYCGVLAIVFRCLFQLHQACLDMPATPVLEHAQSRSRAALVSTARMAIESWEHHGSHRIELGLPICCDVNIQHAKHVIPELECDAGGPKTHSWEQRLLAFETAFRQRWR